jgi:hypothetical protein
MNTACSLRTRANAACVVMFAAVLFHSVLYACTASRTIYSAAHAVYVQKSPFFGTTLLS